MQKESSSQSAFFNPRVFVALAFCALGAALAIIGWAANPPSGTINPAGPTVNWAGTGTGGGATDESSCVEGVSCDTFFLTVSGAPNDWVGKKVRIAISAGIPAVSDYDLYVHKGDNSGPLVGSSASGGTPPEVVDLNPTAPATGTGVFSVHVVYFSASAADQYSGSASVALPTVTSIPPAPADTGPKIGYENFEAPGTLINVTSSSQGPSAATVEYLGHDAGEPSIGVNWLSTQDTAKGLTTFQSDLQTLFVKFDDSCPANGQSATWYNSQAPTSQFVDSDPIGFTDRFTGRVFANQLTLLSPTSKVSFTDTDGLDALGQPGPDGWTASSGPLGSGVDHQTMGGGPFHAPLTRPSGVPGLYADAVYYCSQDLVTAFCLRSDNGGANFGAPVSTYTTECGGLHGHVKVAPNTPQAQAHGDVGTVYLPNNDCGGQGAVVVSENNGVTWSVSPVPGTAAAINLQDPAVAIDDAGRVYFGMASTTDTTNGQTAAVVATSTDRGQTWQNLYDVGAAFGLKNIAYPAATAGDAGRAAIAFYGTTTGGNDQSPSFNGVWHLYVAHTFDGGATWTTTDLTPNDPVQRGCIWQQGGANICRNLLDFFDMTIDKQGRVQVGYADGCTGGHCAQAAPSAKGNGYTATAVIARQSSGRRMLAAFDPPNPLTATAAPGMPLVTQRRVGNVVHLAWSEADTGNSSITSYQILRGSTSGGETLLATLPATANRFDDAGAFDTSKTYYYKVRAVNGVGASCPNNEIAAPYLGDICTGLIVQQTPPGHPEQSAQGNAPDSLAIDSVAVGEPPGPANLMFKMKVTSLASVPPNSRWRIVWDSYASSGQQFYVGMRTDQNGAASFEYGEIATQVVGVVIGVPTETPIAAALPASNFNPDGTITIFVPKSAVGNPPPGDLLGAVNGRTFTGDTPDTQNLERSTALVDHTFVKAQRDNGFPAATYTVAGNCILPLKAESVKTHGAAGPFSVPLRLDGPPGIECRVGTPSGKDFQVVITFPAPILSIAGDNVSSSDGLATADPATITTVNGQGVVTVNLHNVSNAQTIGVNLLGVTDGTNSGDVTVPMGVLLGDVNSSRSVTNGDVSLVKAQVATPVGQTNFRNDVNANGAVTNGDVSLTKAKVPSSLP